MIRVSCKTLLTAVFALLVSVNSNSVLAQDKTKDESKAGATTNKRKSDGKQVREIRILSYNIHAGRGLDGKLDLQRIANVIKKTNPDLVALQEVDVNTKRSGKVDQAKKLAQLCNMKSFFGKAINYQGGGYGNAILSAENIVVSNAVEVSKSGAERRVAVGAAIKVGKGKNDFVTLISTHFDHKSSKARKNAASAVANIIRQSKGVILVAGDLNAPLGSPELAPLEQLAASPSEAPVFTFPAANPTKQIDFILIDKQAKWTLLKMEAIDDRGASDHRPLLAVFKTE